MSVGIEYVVDSDGYEAIFELNRLVKIRLCKDCKHYTNEDDFGNDDDLCTRWVGRTVVNPINGDETTNTILICTRERQSTCQDRCGVFGKYWASK